MLSQTFIKSTAILTVAIATLLTSEHVLFGSNIDLVTLPNRNSVALTIYNSEDITLVKETRYVTLKRGLNQLQFSWANTLIDPTSVEFRRSRKIPRSK